MNIETRFWKKVNKTEGCWIWTASTTGGYGQFWTGTHTVRAHRWSFEQAHGPIPEGLVLDHLCRNRACVRPEHLRACSQRQNVFAPGSQSPAAVRVRSAEGFVSQVERDILDECYAWAD